MATAIVKLVFVMQERDQLKARAKDEAAAQEARKNKVTVTVDLLGRKVIVAPAPRTPPSPLLAATCFTSSGFLFTGLLSAREVFLLLE